MPYALTDAQKEFIHTTISHLIDLSPEEKQLGHEIAGLKQALEENPLEEKHEHAQLQKCYFNPTAWFHRLEHLNPDISVGLVQEYILDLIMHRVEEACGLAHLDAAALEWNPLTYLEKLHRLENTAAFETTFHSQPLVFDTGEHPWQIPINKEKIFTAEFLQLREFRLLQVQINVDLPGWRPLEGQMIEYPDYVETDEDEDDFMRAQQPVASKEAELRVVDSLLQHLVTTGILTPSEKARASHGAKKLLVYRFYFNAISQRTIDFGELIQLGFNQADHLSEPAVTSLIGTEKCDVGVAKNFTPPELAVIKNPFYSHEIIHDRIELQEVKGVGNSQSYLLNLPGVIYLQRKGKISFSAAKTISPSAAPAFKSEPCLRLIMEDKAPFQEVKRLKADEALLFAESFYAGEVFLERLSLNEIKRFSPEEIKNLLFPPLIELQKINKVSRADAKAATPSACTILGDEFYFNLILKGDLAFIDIKDINPQQVTVLLHPKIKQLIKMGALKPQEALLLTGKEKEILVTAPILKLFLAKKLALSDLHKIPFSFSKLLEKNICLYGLIYQNVFTLNDCLNCLTEGELLSHPLTQWGLNFGGRLAGIFKNNPYQENGQADDIHLLKKDLEQVSEFNPRFSRKVLCGQAIKVFFRYLQQELLNEREKNRDGSSLYTQFLSELLLAQRNDLEEKEPSHNTDCVLLINQIARLAQQKALFFDANSELPFGKRARTSLSLFMPIIKGEDIERIKTFHKKIDQVAFLANAYEPREEYRALRY